MTLELFRGRLGVYWRLRAANGRVVAIGAEPFASMRHAKRAFRAIAVHLRVHTYSVVEVSP